MFYILIEPIYTKLLVNYLNNGTIIFFMNLFNELISKNVKIIYTEPTPGAHAKVAFCKLLAFDGQHLKIEYLRDKNIKVISKHLVHSCIEIKSERERDIH